MSRSGYSDDYDHMELYRATVERSIGGKRGQAFLRGLAKALDEMPEKKLIAGDLITKTGEVCAIGAFCKAKDLNVQGIDVDNRDQVGRLVDISPSMAAEIAYENDDRNESATPEQRWERMRKWVSDNLKAIDVRISK